MQLEVTKENAEKQIFSFAKNKVLVGRGKDADLRLDGDEISRKHFYLEFADGKYYIEDLGAANGVFANQERVPANTRVEVQVFFPIQVGAHIFINILEIAPAEQMSSNSSSVRMQRPAGASDSTSSRSINMPKSGAAVSAPRSKEKSGDKKPYLFIALVLAGIGYYAYTKLTGTEEIAVTEVVTGAVSPQEVKMAEIKHKFELQLTPGQLREKKRLETHFQSLCTTEYEKTICGKLKIGPPEKDGAKIISEENKLIIFRNMTTAADSTWGKEFDRIARERRYDFMMSSLTLLAVKDNTFKNIELVDYKITEGVFIPLASVEIYRAALENYTQQQTEQIINTAKESGELKQYDQTLRNTHIIGFFINPTEMPKDLQK